ncbi:hypothetical protein GQ53DRAFT_317556 [Thozetella sp. PMI_491]|nr:hypothetical protein GQ53DRAFT_317556 [Thozetella sp. PMI_491]
MHPLWPFDVCCTLLSPAALDELVELPNVRSAPRRHSPAKDRHPVGKHQLSSQPAKALAQELSLRSTPQSSFTQRPIYIPRRPKTHPITIAPLARWCGFCATVCR